MSRDDGLPPHRRRPIPPPPDSADDDRGGCTNPEEWLHAQAGEVEGG